MARVEEIVDSFGGAFGKGGGMTVTPLVILMVLLVLQGGYAPSVSSFAALVLSALGLIALARVRRMGARISFLTALPAVIPLLSLVSALSHGPSYSSLESGGRWALFAAVVVLSAAMPPYCRRRLLKSAVWSGVLSSMFGLAMTDPVFQALGWSNAGRLQFFFQYANTAGIWFSVVAVLSWFSEIALLRRLVYLPVACLILTQSGGSILLFGVALVPMAVIGLRRWGLGSLLSLVSQLVCAVAIFFVCGASPVFGVLLAMVFCAIACFFGRRADVDLCKSSARNYYLAVIIVISLVVTGAVLLAFMLASGRLAQASQTMVERVIQILDGLELASGSPLLGIGPDAWRHSYREVQSAQYVANSIHCGYLQLILDAGIVSLLAFVLVAVLALIGLGRGVPLSPWGWARSSGNEAGRERRAWGPLVSACLLLTHALIDIDFQFGLILTLLGLLIGEGLGRVSNGKVSGRLSVAPCLALCALLGAISCWAGGARASVLARLSDAGDSLAVSSVASDPLAARDVECQTEILRTYYDLGDFVVAIEFSTLRGLPRGGEQALVVAQCHYALGDRMSAESVLLECLGREPRFTELFETVARLFDAYGASESAVVRYNEIVELANGLMDDGLTALLINQRRIPTY